MKRLLLIGCAALVCCSCAFTNPRNRPLMNWCERHLVPESTAGKAVTAPVVLPVCLAAGVLDTVVVHPVMVADQAWYDTDSVLWGPTGRGYVTECALLPLRAAFTAPLWALDFTGRVLFDVPRWPPSPERLGRQLRDGGPEARLLAAKGIHWQSYQGKDAEAATDVMLDACRAHAADVPFCEAVIERLPCPLTDRAQAYLAGVAGGQNGRLAAMALKRLFLDTRPAASYSGPAGREADAAEAAQIARAADRLARVYDDLVKTGNHEAEVCLAYLVGMNCRWPGPQALGLYIVRSLAQRGWPDYAEGVSFLIQKQALFYSQTAWIDAVAYEWRALRVNAGWIRAADEAVARRRAGGPARTEELLRQQDEILGQLRGARPGEAVKLRQLSEQLVHIKTIIDAEEVAGRLLTGPDGDLKLFTSQDPFEVLSAKGKQP